MSIKKYIKSIYDWLIKSTPSKKKIGVNHNNKKILPYTPEGLHIPTNTTKIDLIVNKVNNKQMLELNDMLYLTTVPKHILITIINIYNYHILNFGLNSNL